MIQHMQITAYSEGQGRTLLKMAAAWQEAKRNAQVMSGPVPRSPSWQSLLLPRAVLWRAGLFHHPVGVGIPDKIFSGATYPFQMFHALLLSRLLSALPMLAVQASQCCTHTPKTCSCTLTKCQFTLRSVAGVIPKSCNVTCVRQLLLPFPHLAWG